MEEEHVVAYGHLPSPLLLPRPLFFLYTIYAEADFLLIVLPSVKPRQLCLYSELIFTSFWHTIYMQI